MRDLIERAKDVNEMCEVAIVVDRSPLWNRIYNVARQIPRQDVKCDAMDASSAATEIEQIVLKTATQSQIIDVLTTALEHYSKPDNWVCSDESCCTQYENCGHVMDVYAGQCGNGNVIAVAALAEAQRIMEGK